jgi:hypothetical protein
LLGKIFLPSLGYRLIWVISGSQSQFYSHYIDSSISIEALTGFKNKFYLGCVRKERVLMARQDLLITSLHNYITGKSSFRQTNWITCELNRLMQIYLYAGWVQSHLYNWCSWVDFYQSSWGIATRLITLISLQKKCTELLPPPIIEDIGLKISGALFTQRLHPFLMWLLRQYLGLFLSWTENSSEYQCLYGR